MASLTRRLDSWFGVSAAESTLRREALAGATTFLAMAYIVFVNPAVLSQAGMDFGAVFTATCMASALATLVMALVANYPVALAPGMGQNFFFVTAVTTMGLTWQQALAAAGELLEDVALAVVDDQLEPPAVELVRDEEQDDALAALEEDVAAFDLARRLQPQHRAVEVLRRCEVGDVEGGFEDG